MKVKVIGQSLQSQDEKLFAMFFVLKWLT